MISLGQFFFEKIKADSTVSKFTMAKSCGTSIGLL